MLMTPNQPFPILILIVHVLHHNGRSYGTPEDPVQSLIVEEYLGLCPTVFTCTALPSYPPSYLQEPCCSGCSCLDECGENCCPDKPGLNYTLPDESKVALEECISNNYRRFDARKHTFTMVTKCPLDYEHEQVREQCESEHPNNASYIEGPVGLVPVNVGSMTYKNKFCALCHSADEADFVYWNMTFACTGVPSHIPSSFDEILKTVQTLSNQCDLDYNAPHGVDPIECETRIDKCNVSGTWEKYDETVAKACNSYTSTFASAYRNVHCYLCNGHNVSEVETFCEDQTPNEHGAPKFNTSNLTSFEQLLDFNRLKKMADASTTEATYQDNTVLDPLKGTYLNLTCGRGFVLSSGECKAPYQSLSGWKQIVYRTVFTLAPPDHRATEDLRLEDIKSMLKETISNITVNQKLVLCSMMSFVKIRSSIRELIFDMYFSDRALVFSDIEYVALYVLFSKPDPVSIMDTVRKLEDSIGIFRSNFVLNFRSIHFDKFVVASTFETHFEGFVSKRDAVEHDMLNNRSQLLARLDYLALDMGYDENGIGLLPLIYDSVMTYCSFNTRDHYMYEVDFATSCAKVEISSNSYNISINETHVAIKGFKEPFERRRVSLSEYGDVIRICEKDFINAVKERNLQYDNVDTNSPLILVTIVCVSFSLLALLLTLVIYCVFPDLRTVPGLNNIGLISSLIVTYALTLVNALADIAVVWACRAVGIVLHFALLSSFCWMFVCTLHMARVFATMTQRASSDNSLKTFIYYACFAELVSILVVVVTVVVSYVSTGGASIGYADAPCYVEADTLVYNVAIPVALVIVLNLIMFGYVIVTFSRLPNMRKSSTHERHNIKIFAKLSTLTGLTWIFGFVYQFTNIEAFAYLFTILNASQGLVIMFSFVINRRVFQMVKKRKEEIGRSNSKQVKTISK